MNLKALFKIIAWNLGILFGGVIIVELIFGGWFGAPQLWSLNIVRDYHVEFNVPDLYRRNDLVHYRKDIWGFRGNYGQVADINIVAFGVSDNETWPAVLNSCLRQNNINSNMANAGISGQSSVGHILNFSKWLNFIPDFAPKYGVFLIGYNESLGFSDYQDPHNIKGGGTNTKFQAFRKWAKINSALYNFYQVIRGNVKAWNAGLSPLRKIKTYITKSKQTRPSVDSLDGIYKSKRNIEIGSTRFNELDKKIRKQKRELLSAYKKRLQIFTS